MWRHGLLLRCKPRFLIFKESTLNLVIKPSYLKSGLCIKGVCDKSPSLFPIRYYSKVAAVVLPENRLEVKSSELINDNGPGDLSGPSSTFKDNEINSEDKISEQEGILKAMAIEDRETDSEDWPIKPRRRPMTGSSPTYDDCNKPTHRFVEYRIDHNEKPVKQFANEQDQILFEAIEIGKELTCEDWKELRKRVLAAGDRLNVHNIDASIIGICITHKKLGTGKSYIDYLSASAQELNVATVSKFLMLSFICSTEINEAIQDVISSLYDSLRVKYPTLDASTAENVLHGLSVTKRWKEGLEILDEIRFTCTPNTSTYSSLIKAAFDNDDPDVGWELMSKMLLDNRKPMTFVYESWLQYCRRFAAGNKRVEEQLVDKLLYFFANNDLRLSEDVVKIVRLWFEYDAPPEEDWNVEFTSVDSRGMCKSCNQYLKPIAVSKEEFELLKSAFIGKTIVGSDIFVKSTPKELEEFQDFVRKTAPYDVVIDGLNVGYSAGTGKGNPRIYGRMLQSVVQHFVNRSQKVLVLGRRHMHRWPRDSMDFVYENAEVFLAQDLSQDDPYLLYAAMYSGIGTCFVSRDLMRGHAFLIKDPKLQTCFRRWQRQHQYMVLHIDGGGEVRFKMPSKINSSTQRGRNGSWHIPYDLESDMTRNQDFNPSRQWLCLSRYGGRRYSDLDDSSQFSNSWHMNKMHDSNNEPSQFAKNGDRRFDDGSDNVSRFERSRYVDQRFGDDNRSQFRKSKHINQRFDEEEEEEEPLKLRSNRRRERRFDDDEEEKPLQFRSNRRVEQRFDEEEELSQSKSNGHAARRFGDGNGSFQARSKQLPKKTHGYLLDDDEEEPKEQFKSRVPKLLEDLDSNEDNYSQSFRSKQLLSEQKFEGEMLESNSKQAFKSNRTQRKPGKKDDG